MDFAKKSIYKWTCVIIFSVSIVIVGGIEEARRFTGILKILGQNLIVSTLAAVLVFIIYRCVQLRAKLDKGEHIRRDIHILVASTVFILIEMYLRSLTLF